MAVLSTPRSAVQLASKGRPVREHLFRIALIASLGIAFVFLAALLSYVLVEGWPRIDSRLWENMPSVRNPDIAGAQSAITGTLWVISLTAVLTLPTGIAAAIYLEEYADKTRWWNRVIELNIQNLAAIPSIVYGILGLGIIARTFGLGFSVITASMTLGLLVLPIVIIASREAIRAVPPSIREGSLALGATQWQTISRQVLPASIPGIATGSILALSRAIGEAAPLLMLGAVSFIRFNPDGVFASYTVLPIQIFNWISQSREGFHVLASAAIVILLLILLLMNSVAIWLRNRYQKRW
ncbi:phosphate ABC transporter permease PstA [Nonomuraea glycinis]|jgi:phosphate transport system permease protein|uniref:Phosphate transport system permease protein PstA n=1 Tax=Nonomuraea glycinis TaxID=2047744 RepID=A0A918A1J4_9ACTN|nr:phosphate ABC transporter permease PstA [Nonomuraea glycinis]MCA2180435.1 phosphate ABC transporter permease PstA [Nonomuraea glycinis]WSG69817.1 phosphate ABC transporter permease PstA [Nonomuraea glycinis]GGP04179.1 phosphate transport system permease protein PstA [Nonomuraea glycinis]